ncbi:MAG: hypothetical protein V1911_01050 [Candidatus Micrarchaeota archaeon]
MGMAMIVYQVYPEEGYDLQKLVDTISKIDKIKSVQREPIAFGLEILKVGALVDDKKDNPQAVEDAIKSAEGVREVESVDVTLIS